MKEPTRQTCLEADGFKAIPGRSAPDCGACMEPGCGCCLYWSGVVRNVVDVAGGILKMAHKIAGTADGKEAENLRARVESLEVDNKKHAEANRELSARANKISVPSSKKKTNPGKAGRPKGQKATINKRPDKVDCTEIVDFDRCPGCGGENVSEKPTGEYDRIVKTLTLLVKTIKYVTVRRWCRDCKKQVSARPPGTAPHARYGANVGAVLNFLNMSGLSHARSAEFAGDALGTPVSCSSAYRNKISRALQMAPERDAVRKKILKEPHLGADEFHWPLKGRRGYGVVALGKESCLVEIVDSRKTKTIKGVLPGYEGTITQDSYPAWLHVGSARQMCVVHQERLAQKDLKLNPGGDVAEFLAGLSAVHKKIYRAWRIKDPHSRAVSADCIDAELAGLFAAPYKDDKHGTIAKYRKRRYREGYYMTTCLRIPGISPDNNAVERANRRFVSVRNDGGGNRSQKGMDANSVLFTMVATDRVRKKSFFDHLIRSASGDR